MNSRIIATCPQCNAQLAVGGENAGKRIRCPKCQSAVQVPDGEVAPPNPSAEVDAAPASGSTADRITASCPKCNAKLAVGVEKSGMQLHCPQCQAVVQVPERSESESPPPPQVATLWNVVVGTKKIGPFGKAKLRALVDAEKLSGTAFVRDVPGEADWSEVQTVPWLFDSPERGHFRYCPECDCRVIVTNSPQSKPVRCPDCTAPVMFVDYLDFTAKPELELPPPEPWNKFDILVIIAAGVAFSAGFFGAMALLWNPPLSMLLGFIFVVAGGGLFSVTFHHRSQTKKYRDHLSKVEQALDTRTNRLATTSEELEGLKRSLVKVRNTLVQGAEEEFRQQRAELAEKIATAEDSVNAVHRMAERFLDETRKWWTSKLTGDNFQTTKERITKAIAFCRKQGYTVSTKHERELMAQLKVDYEDVLRREHERGEQRRVREQMREELRVQREVKRELERQETEKRTIEKALNDALQKAGAEHSAEVELLREKLREAEERSKRTQAQAELTKVGTVYVISNIGSFGERVFKVGLTRRLIPQERVDELGDASVPFTFDVHMMVRSDDAPSLEFSLHRALHKYRVNRVNFRKEFFRVDLETIKAAVKERLEEHRAAVEIFTVDAEASQYRQSLTISDDDFDFLAKVAEATGIEDEDDDLEGADDVLPTDAA
jgi:hypothetical protein